jgi:hypothetical protein
MSAPQTEHFNFKTTNHALLKGSYEHQEKCNSTALSAASPRWLRSIARRFGRLDRHGKCGNRNRTVIGHGES